MGLCVPSNRKTEMGRQADARRSDELAMGEARIGQVDAHALQRLALRLLMVMAKATRTCGTQQ